MQEEALYKLGQKVYLTLNGVYNDVAGDERTTFVDETIDWLNQFLEEFVMEADWNSVRENSKALGTVTTSSTSLTLDSTIAHLVNDWQRPVVMTRTDGQKVTWQVVEPNLLFNAGEAQPQANRVAVVGRKLKFSRPFNDEEIGASIVGDVIKWFPEVTRANIESLSLVLPKQILVLGMAKNQVLPDVVNNTLTANYDVKYQRLLKKALAIDGASTEPGEVLRDDLSFVNGVY